MSISALYQLQNEMNRIGIAGVQVAVGDMKLKKIYEEMKKSGEKIAVFSKIAEFINKLLETGDAKDFYELSKLSSAVLYTQGSTGKKGDMKDIKTIPLTYKTVTSFRDLSPVIDALTTKGSGRLEIIRSAYQRGIFKDLRLVQHLMHALGDSYSEIADFVFEKIVEVYGEEIVPIAKMGIDFDGKNEHARRIDIISSLAKGKEKDFYLEALEKGSKEVRTSAVYALKDCPDTLDIVMQRIDDRSKEVREAAYTVIGMSDSIKGTELLIKAIRSPKTFDVCIEGVKNNSTEEVAQVLVEEAEKCLEDIGNNNKNSVLSDKLFTIFRCVQNKKYNIVYEFLKKFLIKVCESKAQGINYPIRMAGEILEYSTREDLIDFLIDLRNQGETVSNEIMGLSFRVAIKYKNAAEVFDMYSGLLKGKAAKQNHKYSNLIEMIDNFINTRYWIFDDHEYSNYKNVLRNMEAEDNTKLDKRWLKVFIDLDEVKLVCRLASKEEPECIDYLKDRLNKFLSEKEYRVPYKKKGIHVRDFIFGLIKAEYKDIEDLIVYSFKIYLDYEAGSYFNDYRIFSILNFLPISRMKDIDFIRDKQISRFSGSKIYEGFVETLKEKLSEVKYIE